MKKMICVILILLSVTLTACNNDRKNNFPDGIIGTWEGGWEYNGNYISEVISVYDDGYYNMIQYINGDIYEKRYGIWEISEYGAVCFYYRGKDGPYNEYRFTNGLLTTWDEQGEKEIVVFVKTA